MLLGKKKLTAETGAGRHGVALATAAAYFGMECEIHMGEIDMSQADDALFAIGSVVGPHPFPMIVRDSQHVVGVESREQFLDMTGALPDMVAACLGGEFNAMGIFSGFIDDDDVALYGVKPMGTSSRLGEHAATITFGEDGNIHGS